jgi:predicted O-methyltransferase YrrM
MQLLRELPQVNTWVRPDRSWPELVQFSVHFCRGLIVPLQVPSEIARALEVVEALEPRVILEIGTARGGTFFLLSRAAAESCYLISLDLPQGPWGGGYAAWKRSLFRRLLRRGQKADFVRADSHSDESLEQVRRLLRGRQLDVLFIDGDHSYEGVKRDCEMYSPLLRPGGLVIFHDVAKHAAELRCHVHRFWHEVRISGKSMEIIADPDQGWAGIGLLFPGVDTLGDPFPAQKREW